MKILFDQIETVVYPHFKDGEGEWHMKLFNDGQNKYLQGMLPPGSSIGLHAHEGNSEVFYIVSGTGKVLCDGVYEEVGPGDVHYCPMGHSHSLINDGQENLVVFGAVPEHRDTSKD